MSEIEDIVKENYPKSYSEFLRYKTETQDEDLSRFFRHYNINISVQSEPYMDGSHSTFAQSLLINPSTLIWRDSYINGYGKEKRNLENELYLKTFEYLENNLQ